MVTTQLLYIFASFSSSRYPHLSNKRGDLLIVFKFFSTFHTHFSCPCLLISQIFPPPSFIPVIETVMYQFFLHVFQKIPPSLFIPPSMFIQFTTFAPTPHFFNLLGYQRYFYCISSLYKHTVIRESDSISIIGLRPNWWVPVIVN